jgi:hypothetical protein
MTITMLRDAFPQHHQCCVLKNQLPLIFSEDKSHVGNMSMLDFCMFLMLDLEHIMIIWPQFEIFFKCQVLG